MLNKAILVGRLTADPELKQTANGVAVTSFTVAVNRAYVTNGKREADFINVIAWRASAEFVCKYFKKGNSIGIDGSIQTRSYEDKNGNKRTAVEVVAGAVSFVESAKKDNPPLPDAPPDNTLSDTGAKTPVEALSDTRAEAPDDTPPDTQSEAPPNAPAENGGFSEVDMGDDDLPF